MIASCSNAGRWGPDDELGTLNLITPQTRRCAASLVREGVSVSMGSTFSVNNASPFNDNLRAHSAYVDPAAAVAVADTLELRIHGWGTHLDAIGHVYHDGIGYNNRRRDAVFGEGGLTVNAITAMRDGIFTRGVLLDVAATLGLPWLPADHVVSGRELDQAERAADVRIATGDAVFVRTGLADRIRSDPGGGSDARAGLGVDAVRWLHQRDIAVFGGDCVERLPSADPDFPLPLHQIGIAAMGLALLDWPDLDRLVQACADYRRHDFLLTVAPLPIAGGTGSPVNPVATF